MSHTQSTNLTSVCASVGRRAQRRAVPQGSWVRRRLPRNRRGALRGSLRSPRYQLRRRHWAQALVWCPLFDANASTAVVGTLGRTYVGVNGQTRELGLVTDARTYNELSNEHI